MRLLLKNEVISGSLQPFEGGSGGPPAENFVKNMPSFGGHFGIELSIFDLFSLFT